MDQPQASLTSEEQNGPSGASWPNLSLKRRRQVGVGGGKRPESGDAPSVEAEE